MSDSFKHISREIAIKIKARRIRLKYTQKYMACRLLISQNAYSKIESGRTKISIERLYEIAEILEVKATNLLRKDN